MFKRMNMIPSPLVLARIFPVVPCGSSEGGGEGMKATGMG
jgi:hypothetical protein